MNKYTEPPDDWISVELSISCEKMVQCLLDLITAAGDGRPLLPLKFAIEEAAANVLSTECNRTRRDKSAKDTSWEARGIALEFPDIVESIETLNPLLARLSVLAKKLKAHGECGSSWDSSTARRPGEHQSSSLNRAKLTKAAREKRVTAEEQMRALYAKEKLSIEWTAEEWAERLDCDPSTIKKTQMWKVTLKQDREAMKQASVLAARSARVK